MERKRIKIALRISLVIAILLQLAGTAWADEVTEWNKIMLEELRVAGIAGIVATRQAATVQSSVYDAVNGIERRFTPIHVQPDAAPGASVRAAAIQAAYATLIQIVRAHRNQGSMQSARRLSPLLQAVLQRRTASRTRVASPGDKR